MAKIPHHTTTQSPWYTSNAKLAIAIIGMFVVAFLTLRLIGSSPPQQPQPQLPTGDYQEIRMAVIGTTFSPDSFTVTTEKPVRWIIDGSRSVGCTQYLIAQELGISKKLDKGENIISFTPPGKGSYRFTCGMGMVEGTIHVI